jgi:hypothetical protein
MSKEGHQALIVEDAARLRTCLPTGRARLRPGRIRRTTFFQPMGSSTGFVECAWAALSKRAGGTSFDAAYLVPDAAQQSFALPGTFADAFSVLDPMVASRQRTRPVETRPTDLANELGAA